MIGLWRLQEELRMDPTDPTLSRRGLVAVSMAAVALGAAATEAQAAGTVTVPDYIVERLHGLGVRHLFGVPGATCDPLFEAAQAGPLEVVVTSSDLDAGYAADGYARTAGIGAVALTYGVGARTILPVVGGAYAERSPMLIVNGGPSPEDLRLQNELGTLFSHSDGTDDGDLRAFQPVTAYARRVTRASELPEVLDAALRTALEQQRPVYVEVARNLWWSRCTAPSGAIQPVPVGPPPEEALLARIQQRLAVARRPIVLAGVGLRRFGLQDTAAALIEALGVPWATTMLGKAVLDENSGGFAGVYAGTRSVPELRDIVEGSDCVLALGCVFGRQYRHLVTRSTNSLMRVDVDGVRIANEPAVSADQGAVLDGMLASAASLASEWRETAALPALDFATRRASLPKRPHPAVRQSEAGIGYDTVMALLSERLTDEHLLVTDTSLSMYPAAEVHIRGRDGVLCNAVWASIGYSVGASVGAALGQSRRPVVVCGDGGFQMTCQALSSMARHELPNVVLVLDNGLYGIEQWLLDKAWYAGNGRPPRAHFALQPWRYDALAQAMGVEHAVRVETAEALATALDASLTHPGPSLLSVRVPPHDLPQELRA